MFMNTMNREEGFNTMNRGQGFNTMNREEGFMTRGYRQPRQMVMDITSPPPQDIALENILDMRNYNGVLRKKIKRSKKQSKRKVRR